MDQKNTKRKSPGRQIEETETIREWENGSLRRRGRGTWRREDWEGGRETTTGNDHRFGLLKACDPKKSKKFRQTGFGLPGQSGPMWWSQPEISSTPLPTPSPSSSEHCVQIRLEVGPSCRYSKSNYSIQQRVYWFKLSSNLGDTQGWPLVAVISQAFSDQKVILEMNCQL